MMNKLPRFKAVSVVSDNFSDNLERNAELAALWAEGWQVVDCQAVVEGGKSKWLAIMAPPRIKETGVDQPLSAKTIAVGFVPAVMVLACCAALVFWG